MAETKSLKIQIHHARQIIPYGTDEPRLYSAGDVVEVPREEALGMITANLADGVDSSTKAAKGRARNEPDAAPVAPKSKAKG